MLKGWRRVEKTILFEKDKVHMFQEFQRAYLE